MIPAFVITALYAGLPVPEVVARPVVLRIEAMDEREQFSYICWPARLRHAARLPLMAERGRLPPGWVCFDHYVFATEHMQWLRARERTDIDRDWGPWIKDAQWRREFWTKADDSYRDYMYVICRREALQKCRDIIGPLDWFHGRLPASVPLHLFHDEP